MIILLFLITLPAFSQIEVTISAVSPSIEKRMLGSRLTKEVQMVLVGVENKTDGPVSISESAVLRHIVQFQPVDHRAMSILITEASTNSVPARLGRLGGDMSNLAAFLTASSTLHWGTGVLIGATAVSALAPQFVKRVQGIATPVASNFESLAWVNPLSLAAGESGSAYMFTAVRVATSFTFTIDISHIKIAKVIQ